LWPGATAMRLRAALVGAVVVALGILGWLFHMHAPTGTQPTPAGDRIAGGDGGGLPRATLAIERIDAAAVERAAGDGSSAGLRAFVIVRDGELVYERYGGGVSGDTPVDGGGFARALLALAFGIAAGEGVPPASSVSGFDPASLRQAIETASAQSYPAYLSRRLWSRLNAGPAWIEHAPGTAVPADCCVHARVLDWMRVATLLVDGGHFEGKQLVAAKWLQRMQQPLSADSLEGFGVELAPSASGAEHFASPGVFFLRGLNRWRIWLVPPLRLAVLFGSDLPAMTDAGAVWDETRLPNAVIRAVSDRPPEAGDLSQLQRLVPGH